MRDELEVDLAQLEQVAARLGGLAKFMAEQLAILDHKAAVLHTSGWSGATAAAHAAAHQEWSGAAKKFAGQVAAMSADAQHAHQHFTAASDRNVRMLRG